MNSFGGAHGSHRKEANHGCWSGAFPHEENSEVILRGISGGKGYGSGTGSCSGEAEPAGAGDIYLNEYDRIWLISKNCVQLSQTKVYGFNSLENFFATKAEGEMRLAMELMSGCDK